MGTKLEHAVGQLRSDVAELYELSSETNKTVDITKCLARDVDLRVRRLQKTNGRQFGIILATQRQHGKRFDHVEARLDRVEERLDRVEERLDRVDARLDILTETVQQLAVQMQQMTMQMHQMMEEIRQLAGTQGAVIEILVERGVPPQDGGELCP